MIFKPYVLSQFGIDNKFNSYNRQVCIFIDGLWLDREEFLNSDIKIFVGGCEPDIALEPYYTPKTLIENHKRFDLILTRHEEVIEKCNNAKLFPFGSSWISDDFKKIATNFEVSFLCGIKNHFQGHKLRHEIFSTINNFNLGELTLKLNMRVDKKESIFNTSQYSIIVENNQNKNYFTEKIVDSFITKTIPIYWGCPNISDFFDSRGIISFNSNEELYQKLSSITPDIYNSKIDIIESNYIAALKYKNFHSRVDKEIEKIL